MTTWLSGDTPDTEPLSAGALMGWGVFTTLGVWNGKPYAALRHLTRLRHDAERASIAFLWNDETLLQGLHHALSQSRVTEGLARITVTRRGDDRWNCNEGSDLSIAVQAIARQSPLSPARLQLSSFRIEARRPLAGVKSTSYLDYQLSWLAAKNTGFDDALLCNSSGALCECSRANLFWTHGGTLFTPSQETGCLPGIAREQIIDWALEEGIPVRQGAFLPHELQAAEEIFSTASSLGPRPVAFIELGNDWNIELQAPGALTRRFAELWKQAVTALGPQPDRKP